MIGYVVNGYRFWGTISRRIAIALDVKFDESSYPYVNSEETADAPLVILPPDEQEGKIFYAIADGDADQFEEDEENPGNQRFEITDDQEEIQAKDPDEHEGTRRAPFAIRTAWARKGCRPEAQ